MSDQKNKDLLRTSLCFRKLSDQKSRGNFQIIEEVCAGHITKINDHFQQMEKMGQTIEITRMCNSMDAEGKTPLFYAWMDEYTSNYYQIKSTVGREEEVYNKLKGYQSL